MVVSRGDIFNPLSYDPHVENIIATPYCIIKISFALGFFKYIHPSRFQGSHPIHKDATKKSKLIILQVLQVEIAGLSILFMVICCSIRLCASNWPFQKCGIIAGNPQRKCCDTFPV